MRVVLPRKTSFSSEHKPLAVEKCHYYVVLCLLFVFFPSLYCSLRSGTGYRPNVNTISFVFRYCLIFVVRLARLLLLLLNVLAHKICVALLLLLFICWCAVILRLAFFCRLTAPAAARCCYKLAYTYISLPCRISDRDARFRPSLRDSSS